MDWPSLRPCAHAQGRASQNSTYLDRTDAALIVLVGADVCDVLFYYVHIHNTIAPNGRRVGVPVLGMVPRHLHDRHDHGACVAQRGVAEEGASFGNQGLVEWDNANTVCPTRANLRQSEHVRVDEQRSTRAGDTPGRQVHRAKVRVQQHPGVYVKCNRRPVLPVGRTQELPVVTLEHI